MANESLQFKATLEAGGGIGDTTVRDISTQGYEILQCFSVWASIDFIFQAQRIHLS